MNHFLFYGRLIKKLTWGLSDVGAGLGAADVAGVPAELEAAPLSVEFAAGVLLGGPVFASTTGFFISSGIE